MPSPRLAELVVALEQSPQPGQRLVEAPAQEQREPEVRHANEAGAVVQLHGATVLRDRFADMASLDGRERQAPCGPRAAAGPARPPGARPRPPPPGRQASRRIGRGAVRMHQPVRPGRGRIVGRLRGPSGTARSPDRCLPCDSGSSVRDPEHRSHRLRCSRWAAGRSAPCPLPLRDRAGGWPTAAWLRDGLYTGRPVATHPFTSIRTGQLYYSQTR